MLVFGLNCCFGDLENDLVPDLPTWFYHDSAACLLSDGEVLVAVEEERLIRVKHTNKFSRRSARACLEQAGVTFDQIDRIAFFSSEQHTDKELGLQYVLHPEVQIRYSRPLIAEQVGKEFSCTVDPERIVYVPHHLAHAYSTYFHSGFDEALVSVIDGNGENDSITFFHASRAAGMEKLHSCPTSKSMGHLYLRSTELLGYKRFDEYKVMGLASYGDPAVYEELFQGLYELLPDGEFSFDWHRVQPHFLASGFRPRRRGEEFSQLHCDFAAALQRILEKIVLHVVGYWREKTGLSRLCVAGGVGHNSTLNGTMLYSGMFDEIFVDPASHDAGASIGAALYVAQQHSPQTFQPSPIADAYLGPAPAPHGDVLARLKPWSALLSFEQVDDIVQTTARLLANGAVIGWVQGRSEFGPRALGNRSIIADPRPRSNQDRVNALIKLREAYRPFAPAILAERAADYLALPATRAGYDFMSYVVRVRPEMRAQLGAVTHVDGTTRAQTVDRAHNERFWSLIHGFGELTGVPVLLNTSFNNHCEPIVQTADDAVRCFLTTGLDYLVIDDILVRRKAEDWRGYLDLPVVLPPTVSAHRHDNATPGAGTERGRREGSFEVRFTYTEGKSATISPEMFAFLTDRSAGSLAEFAAARRTDESACVPADLEETIVAEARKLWQDRFVEFMPESTRGA